MREPVWQQSAHLLVLHVKEGVAGAEAHRAAQQNSMLHKGLLGASSL